jgi:hypothetical protein
MPEKPTVPLGRACGLRAFAAAAILYILSNRIILNYSRPSLMDIPGGGKRNASRHLPAMKYGRGGVGFLLFPREFSERVADLRAVCVRRRLCDWAFGHFGIASNPGSRVGGNGEAVVRTGARETGHGTRECSIFDCRFSIFGTCDTGLGARGLGKGAGSSARRSRNLHKDLTTEVTEATEKCFFSALSVRSALLTIEISAWRANFVARASRP